MLPALFAIVQFQSWEAATMIFAGATLIQFLMGSYLEPRLSGSAPAISPFLVVSSGVLRGVALGHEQTSINGLTTNISRSEAVQFGGKLSAARGSDIFSSR